MTGTNHFLTGAWIGTVISSPAIAIPIAFASHIILDVLPHFGRSSQRAAQAVLAVDAALVMIIVGAVWQSGNRLALACGVCALSFDFIWLPLVIAEARGRAYVMSTIGRIHHGIQWGERPWGLAIEVPFAFMILGLWVVCQ